MLTLTRAKSLYHARSPSTYLKYRLRPVALRNTGNAPIRRYDASERSDIDRTIRTAW